MKPKYRPRKEKIPAEFTAYLLEGIRKIRLAATTPKKEPENVIFAHK